MWFFQEIVIFYFNIISIGLFMGFSWLVKYKSIRQRLGLQQENGPFSRKEQDFMGYCSSDMSLMTSRIVIILLSLASLYYKDQSMDNSSLKLTFGIYCTRHSILMLFIIKRFRSIKYSNKLSLVEKYVETLQLVFNVLLIYTLNQSIIKYKNQIKFDQIKNTSIDWIPVQMIEIVFSIISSAQTVLYVFGQYYMVRYWKKLMRQEILADSLLTIEERVFEIQRRRIMEDKFNSFKKKHFSKSPT